MAISTVYLVRSMIVFYTVGVAHRAGYVQLLRHRKPKHGMSQTFIECLVWIVAVRSIPNMLLPRYIHSRHIKLQVKLRRAHVRPSFRAQPHLTKQTNIPSCICIHQRQHASHATHPANNTPVTKQKLA
jgi:hypothetical protein